MSAHIITYQPPSIHTATLTPRNTHAHVNTHILLADDFIYIPLYDYRQRLIKYYSFYVIAK